MSTETQAIFSAWSLPFGLAITIGCVSAVYVRGWYSIRKTRAAYFTGARLVCFLSGMVVLWLAIASPVDGFADVLLSAHGTALPADVGHAKHGDPPWTFERGYPLLKT